MFKVVWNIVKKILGTIFVVLSPLKRLWCHRKRRTSDTILPLSNHYPPLDYLMPNDDTVDVTNMAPSELSPWDSWEEQQKAEKIRSVEEYRQRQQQLLKQQHSREDEVEPDYFQDMTPKVKKQKKVLVKGEDNVNTTAISHKLSMNADIPFLQTGELGKWDESGNSWEVEAEEDISAEAENVVREKRKADRQQRQIEQQRKKMERDQQKQFKIPAHLTAVKLS